MPYLAALTAFALCCSALTAAQQTFVTGETVALPSLASGEADHATVAANSFGDVVVANHAQTLHGNKLVEAVAIASHGQGIFQVAPTILLGDPDLNLLGNDTCRKPDVIALADDSFLVVWPRNDVDHVGGARLEAARIHIRASDGTLLPLPVVDSAAPGEGHVLDPNLVSGDAGVMPDAIGFGPGHPSTAAVVYAHESATFLGQNDKKFREYELRCVLIDWSLPRQSAGFLDGPHVLSDQIPMDEESSQPFNGGMILPDVVLDDYGNLVIAHEESLLAPHHGWSSSALRRIVVERYAGLDDAVPLAPMESWTVALYTATHRPRRPMLASSREDLDDSVSLTWGEQAITGYDNNLGYKMLRLPNHSGNMMPRDAHWVTDPLHEDGMSVVADNGAMRTCFAVRNFPTHRSLLASATLSHGAATIVEIDTPILYPWRPAAELVTVERPNGDDLSYAAICYEGADVLEPSEYGIYFTYRVW